MFRYLNAAFFLRPGIPGLGALPLNLMAVAAFGVAGLAHPALWLLGLGLESAYLFGLSTNRRFQRLVDGETELRLQNEASAYRDLLTKRLSSAARRRLTALEEKYARIKKLYQDRELPDYLVENNRDALRKLLWTYLKLLLARGSLDTEGAWADESDLRRQIAAAEKELSDPRLVIQEVRESKQATLDILRKRLENRDRRAQSLQEIDSDLTRIEAQLDLALENASIPSREPSVATNIQLASRLLDESAYGESGAAVAELEARYDLINRYRESGKERSTA
jgi:hypothetical protein